MRSILVVHKGVKLSYRGTSTPRVTADGRWNIRTHIFEVIEKPDDTPSAISALIAQALQVGVVLLNGRTAIIAAWGQDMVDGRHMASVDVKESNA